MTFHPETSLATQEGTRPQDADALIIGLERRLERLERLLARFIAKSEPDIRLHAVLGCETVWDWFMAGEVYRMAEAERDEAEAESRSRPELIEALEGAGIFNAHALTRWILRQERGFERGGEKRTGVEWRCIPIDQEPGGYAE